MLKMLFTSALVVATMSAFAIRDASRADPHDFPGYTDDMHTACVRDHKCQSQMSLCYQGSAFYAAVTNICQGWPNQYCSVNVLQWCDFQLYNKCIVNKAC